MNVNYTLKQPLTSPQRKILVAHHTSNHRLVIEIGGRSTLPVSRDTRLCRFFSYNIIEIEAHFVLECPLYKPTTNKFPTLIVNVVLRSLKPFFQLDHQVAPPL
jgi:hypothetical protein